jgi:hypothetical protein
MMVKNGLLIPLRIYIACPKFFDFIKIMKVE